MHVTKRRDKRYFSGGKRDIPYHLQECVLVWHHNLALSGFWLVVFFVILFLHLKLELFLFKNESTIRCCSTNYRDEELEARNTSLPVPVLTMGTAVLLPRGGQGSS